MRFVPLLLLLASCLTSIDTHDKRCPCAPGFICDVARDRCVDTACTATVSANDFRAEWATSNAIRYRWTPVGDRAHFVRYELHLAESAEDLLGANARVFGGAENPELSFYNLPRTGGTEDLVESTIAWGLTAQKSYAAQLLVFDTGLCVFRTPAILKSTLLDLPDESLIFRDTGAPGSSMPTEFRDTPDDTGTGRHLEWVPDTDPTCSMGTARVCGENLRRTQLNRDLSTLSPGAFANAFLEFKIANDGTAGAFYARTWLSFRGCGDLFRIEPIQIAPSVGYRTWQVPLSALNNFTRNLTLSDLSDGGPLCEFNVGGQFTRSAVDGGSARIRVDDVRIRY